jgi:ABC-type antimicrobial peptide transport system permease subunit
VLGSFAVLAFLLAALGVFGVMTHCAELRVREIGVRLALGASRAQVAGLVFRDGLKVMGAGLAAGLLAATWLAQTLTGLLHEVTPADPVALVAVGATLAVAGAVAAYLPARRATRLSTAKILNETT